MFNSSSSSVNLFSVGDKVEVSYTPACFPSGSSKFSGTVSEVVPSGNALKVVVCCYVEGCGSNEFFADVLVGSPEWGIALSESQ